MKTTLSRYTIVILGILSLAICLPELYWMVFNKPLQKPYVNYSPILKDFVVKKTAEDGSVIYSDTQGRTYDRKTYETFIPYLTYYNLDKWGVLPDTLDGFPLSISNIRHNRQYSVFRKYTFHTPMIQLYPLFESQSDFTHLELPRELFRISDKIEFIEASTNRILDSLSNHYNAALINSGFQFPAKYIAGNPTTRKPFDEGYFIIDNANNVFHLKKVKGDPFCVKTGISTALNIRYISVEENTRREFYAVAFTWDNEVYLISYDNYKLIRLPIEDFIAGEMDLILHFFPTYRSFQYYDDKHLKCVVTDLNYDVIATYETSWTPKSEWLQSKFANAIFPFSIERRNSKTDYVLFKIQFSNWLALIGIFIALCITLFVKKIVYHENIRAHWWDIVIVAATGLYGALAVLLIRPEF